LCHPRTRPALNNLVAMQAGDVVPEEIERQLGVRNVLPKPFTRDELLSAPGESIDGD
jgi:hypothetical protein